MASAFLVKVVNGPETMTFRCEATTTMADLKRMIFEHAYVPAQAQRVLVKGKSPEDGVVVADLGLKKSQRLMLLLTKEYHAVSGECSRLWTRLHPQITLCSTYACGCCPVGAKSADGQHCARQSGVFEGSHYCPHHNHVAHKE